MLNTGPINVSHKRCFHASQQVHHIIIYCVMTAESRNSGTRKETNARQRCNRAIAQAISHRLLTTVARVRSCGFVVEKAALGQVFSEYFGSPANSHSANCSTITIIYYLCWYNRPNSGRRAKWTQSHPTRKNIKERTAQ
jgi:hypothetical protein